MGAGFKGNFGNTLGTKQGKSLELGIGYYEESNNNNNSIQNNYPIKSLGDVRYNKKKTEEYLLNINHPIGGSKAKFMKEVLGYSQNDSKLFHKNVVSSLIGKTPNKSEKTIYGLKHTYSIKLNGKNGKNASANVVVIIQKDNNRITYKIVTVYPDKKGE